jgi:Uma2 family endonuclease
MTAITLKLNPIIKLNPEQFYLSTLSRKPCNLILNAQLWLWNDQSGLGKVFDSSRGFTLPNKADRAPDASWVEKHDGKH